MLGAGQYGVADLVLEEYLDIYDEVHSLNSTLPREMRGVKGKLKLD